MNQQNNKVTVGKKDYEMSEEIKMMGQDVAVKENIDLANVRVAWVKVYPAISKTTVARCIRASAQVKYLAEFDYIIEVSGEIWDSLDTKTCEILLHHELLHIAVSEDKKGNKVFGLRDHDIKDFSLLINKHGVDWFRNLQTMTASVYDLDPAQEKQVSL